MKLKNLRVNVKLWRLTLLRNYQLVRLGKREEDLPWKYDSAHPAACLFAYLYIFANKKHITGRYVRSFLLLSVFSASSGLFWTKF